MDSLRKFYMDPGCIVRPPFRNAGQPRIPEVDVICPIINLTLRTTDVIPVVFASHDRPVLLADPRGHILNTQSFFSQWYSVEDLVLKFGNEWHPQIQNEANCAFVFFGNQDEILRGFKGSVSSFIAKFHMSLAERINCLWFIKDNSITIGDLRFYNRRTVDAFQQKMNTFTCDSTGNFGPVFFSGEEVEESVLIYDKIKSIGSVPESSIEEPDYRNRITESGFNHGRYKSITRIERALSVLRDARSHSYLPLKIGLYISALECLFSTSKEKVTYYTSARTACYISKHEEERRLTYRDLKRAYSIRSAFYHGSRITQEPAELQAISRRVDEILRVAFRKIIMEDDVLFLSEEETIDTYFFALVPLDIFPLPETDCWLVYDTGGSLHKVFSLKSDAQQYISGKDGWRLARSRIRI